MPNFYRAEYKMIASAMRSAQPPPIFNTEHQQHYRDCISLADMFAKDNPNFNRNIFLHACGGYVYKQAGMPSVPSGIPDFNLTRDQI